MTEHESPTTRPSRLRRIGREVILTLLIGAVVIGGIRTWQSRNLLEDDGSVLAPNIELVGLDGARTELSAFEGKTVLLHFWATW